MTAGLLGAFAGTLGAQTPQGAVVTGRVTTEQGQPLEGANVFISELSLSVGTNAAGNYTITVQAPRVSGQQVQLRVRAVGYTPQARAITLAAGPQTADFALRRDVTQLSEIVVTGVTGATERAKVPFSVTRVDSTSMPVVSTNPLSQLQGKVPGATITSVSGRPGSTPSVILRGPTSINGSGRGQDPLYIVDGVILQGTNPLGDLNPADIESFEVVKGAAAASLYGSRAGAGVISITTRRGTGTDGVRFRARQEVGFNDVEHDFGVAQHHTWLMDENRQRFCVQDSYSAGSNKVCARTIDYGAEAARINNDPGDFTLPSVTFPVDPGSVTSGAILRRAFLVDEWPGTHYNAVQQLLEPKPLYISDLSATGSNGGTSFFASLNYADQGGALQGLKGAQRVGGRINVDQAIGEKWTLALNSFYGRTQDDGFNFEDGGTAFLRLTRVPAIVDITQRDTLGRLFIRTNLGTGGVQNDNPLYAFQNIDRNDVKYRFIGGGTLKYSPLDWVDVEGNFSVDRLNWNFRQFSNRGFRTVNTNLNNGGTIFNGVTNSQSINSSLQATVRRELLPDLNARFNVRALFEEQDNDARNITGRSLRVSDVDNANNATSNQAIVANRNTTRQASFSGGVFLDYKDRYTADLLVRRDGSSRFGPDERFATYGRASAAWLASRERWWPTDVVSQATFRASLGTAGNTPNVAAQYETYTIGAGGALSANTLGNPHLKPEVVTETEIGTDLELFDRVGLTVNYALATTRNQLLPVPVAVSTGFPTQWQNAGTLEGRTLEVSLSAPIFRGGGVDWSGRLNYSRNTTTIKELFVPPFSLDPGGQNTNGFLRIEQGLPYGTVFGRKFVTSCGELPGAQQGECGGPTSAYQRNDEGYIVWVGEGNNPGMGITDNLWNTGLPLGSGPWGAEANFGMPIILRGDDGAGANVAIGNVLPDYRLSFAQNATWKRFSAYALLDGSFGQEVYNQGRHWSYLDFLSHDVDQAGKSLETAKPIGYYYRANSTDGAAGVGGFYDVLAQNSRFMEDASFVKLREVSLGYRLGAIAGRGNWTMSVVGRNLRTWTDYSGFDPEVGLTSAGVATAVGNNGTGSGVLNAIDFFTFPNLRTVSFALSTSF